MNPYISEKQARRKLRSDNKKEMSPGVFYRLISEGELPQPKEDRFESGHVRRYYKRSDIENYIKRHGGVSPVKVY